MDTSIGFLRSGNHINGRHKRINDTNSPYKSIWKQLHLQASRAAVENDKKEKIIIMDTALHFAAQSLDCEVCLKHLKSFNEVNKKWMYSSPEFFIFKLHAAANQNARGGGQMSSLPPEYSLIVHKYRGLLASSRFSLLSGTSKKASIDCLLGTPQ